MLLNDLASLARGAGLTVHEAPGWIGHNHGQLTSVSSIVIHHTAGAATGDYPSYGVVRDGRSGLPGPLAQIGVGRSGKIYIFSNGVAWHAGAVKASWMDNYHAIGLEVESVGTGPTWPPAQVQAAARMTAALCKRYGVPVARVLGHKEVCYPVGRKIDPVGIPGDMPAFRTLVQHHIEGDDVTEQDKQDIILGILGYRNPDVVGTSGPDVYGLLTGTKQDAAEAEFGSDVDIVNQQHIYALEQRVDAMDGKLDAILAKLSETP